MKVAGFLHDLGKLAVPSEILDKPAQLTKAEYNIVRCHTYHTDCLLQDIAAIDTIRKWGALAEERPPLLARVIQVEKFLALLSFYPKI